MNRLFDKPVHPKGILNRDVTDDEAPWLAEINLKKGAVVYRFWGSVYGVITPTGVACTAEPGKGPFFEVPADAIDWEMVPLASQVGESE